MPHTNLRQWDGDQEQGGNGGHRQPALSVPTDAPDYTVAYRRPPFLLDTHFLPLNRPFHKLYAIHPDARNHTLCP